MPRVQWQVVMPGMHPGYIDWPRFEVNQRRLTDNARAFGNEQERRTDHLNVRLMTMERADLDAEARRLGLPVSNYVRWLIGKRRLVEHHRVPAAFHSAVSALNRVGNNLNQLARYANDKGDLAPIARHLDHLLARLETAIDELLGRQS